MLLEALTEVMKLLPDGEGVSEVSTTIERIFEDAQSDEKITAGIIFAMCQYFAAKGEMERSVRILLENREKVTQTLSDFDRMMSMITAVAASDRFILAEAAPTDDVPGKGLAGS
jgi:hypothetical protein